MSNIKTATLELSRNCNFRCAHCYIETTSRDGDYLTSGEWIRIIDRLIGIGCRKYILTGGEAMMSAAFPEIYLHLKKRGCSVDIFTNGSILRKSHKKLFSEYAPESISITLYGNSSEEYQSITGCRGVVRDVVIKNAATLKLMGIRVNLGMIVCKGLDSCANNAGDVAGGQIELNTYLIPALHGKDNLGQRLSPKEVLATELSDPCRNESNRVIYSDLRSMGPDSEDYLRKCPGGNSSIFVSATGLASICAIYRSVSFSLLDEGVPMPKVLQALADVHENFKELYFNSKCGACSLNRNCRNCPAYSLLETGSVDENPYLCELASVRATHYMRR